MKIAIEAVNANKPPEHGSETYLYNLIRSLIAVDRDDTFYLYIDRPVNEQSRLRQNNVVYRHIREIRYIYGLCKRTFFKDPWSEFFLALDLLLFSRPDILIINAGSRLPFIRPYKNLCQLHDLSEYVIPDCYSSREREEFSRSKRRALLAATHVAALSRRTKDDAIKYLGLPEEKITVIYPGYDASIFNTRRDEKRFRRLAQDLKLPGQYLITTGMIHPKKNLVRLAQAFRSMKIAGKFDGSLLIVGPDKYRGEEIRREIGEIDSGHDIIFAGCLTTADMAEMLKGAALFVFPALYEGFGLSLLEAMACGVPSVAARTGALPEVASGSALLVDPYDVEEIGCAMDRALHDADRRGRLRQDGLKRAQDFSWDQTASRYVALFKNMMS